jgi:hypothetical protein
MRYLDPKNDLTFKKVFGQHPHLLKSLLNALLSRKQGAFRSGSPQDARTFLSDADQEQGLRNR